MKDNNISVRDYTHLNGIESPNLLTPEIMEQTIVDNFEKGKITEEIFLGGMNILEKGKRGQIGEVREWSGKKYQKTATGWTPVKEGGESGKKDEPTDGRFKDSKLEEVLKAARTGVNTPENHQAVQELLKRASEKSGKKVTSEPEAISLLTGQGGNKEENMKKNEELNKKDLEKE